MPNWCSTVIKFYSENREQLEAMHKMFNEIRNGKPTVKNDFNNGFMGDYANTYLPELGHEKVECRGWVDGIDEIEHNDKYDVFTVWTETAWGAKMGMWAEIVKRFYPDVHIAYIAEECGCDYFCVWDKTECQMFFPDTYYVDGCLPTKDGKCEYIEDRYMFGSVQDIQDYLDKTLPLEYEHKETVEELMDEVQKRLDEYSENHECKEDLYVHFSEFVEVDPADFDLTI